ncbi:MAG: hypothetical protein ACREPD_05680 [Stenotrophomonas sp.]|uniref:hypothetical protein n=1 Tax=Stenotrophomonas sp. TaxID=69392 RepID=UPI003D6D8CEC
MSRPKYKMQPQRVSVCEMEAAEALDFVSADSWWCPQQVSGPEIAQKLYGRQLAVDFSQWMTDNWSPESFAKIVQAMPKDQGLVEEAFLQMIAEWMPVGSMT